MCDECGGELYQRDDDKHWRGGLFYINREDPALWVARRFGLGWTLNFGNPRAAMLLAGVTMNLPPVANPSASRQHAFPRVYFRCSESAHRSGSPFWKKRTIRAAIMS